MDENGNKVFNAEYDAWGKQNVTLNKIGFHRGYTGHEMWNEFGIINMNGRLYDPALGRFFSPDNYVQAPTNSQNFNRYSYCLNNPLKYTDPSGNFFTWHFGKGGFSFGWNFTDSGYPVGFGINIGWGHGLTVGAYVEGGSRFGGSGFGAGATVSTGIDYNIKHNSWSNTTSLGTSASFACFNAGVGASNTYDFQTRQSYQGWNVSAGVGFGDANSGIGISASYGSNGWSYGIGGYCSRRNPTQLYSNRTIPKGIEPGNPVPATDESLLNFQKKWFPDAPIQLCDAFTVENVPIEKLKEQLANGALAGTVAVRKGKFLSGRSKVYFNEGAFSSEAQLYQAMGHEFVHVSQFYNLRGMSYAKVQSMNAQLEYYAHKYDCDRGLRSINTYNYSNSQLSELINYTNFSWTKSMRHFFIASPDLHLIF